ncbi:MAG: hypothetical protein IPQ07_42945 [Myxococcales bacterium]|nr:hypothetical protein [Myxococcales bacterium]
MKKIALASLVVAAAACGGDSHDKGTVNTASAKASVENVGKINAAMAAGNGANAAAAVQGLTSAGQSLVTPATGAGRLVGLLPESFPKHDLSQAVTGTADCTPTGCTFTNFGDDAAGSSWKINGSVSKTGDTTSFDLTYDVSSAGATVKWAIDGAITITATSIDGSIHSHGVTDVAAGSASAGVNVTWDTAVDYDAITLDAQGCATAGTVHAVVSYSVKSGGNGGAFDVEGSATFGPACGQVTAK